MEPDFDKLVSNKIRQTEQRLVSWNKQTVWRNVQSATDETRRYDYFRYIAAAVILLSIYFGTHLIPNGVKPQLTDANIKSGREATAPEKKSVIPEKNQNPLPDQTAQDPKDNATVPATEIPKGIFETTSLVSREMEDVDAVIEPIVMDIIIQEEEFLLPDEVSVHKQKIRPIVGVIDESYSAEVATVKRKRSLRKLQPPENIPWENPPNALVFARKK